MKTQACFFALCLAVVGCDASEPAPGGSAVYRLVVEGAALTRGPANAQTTGASSATWCADGAIPDLAARLRTQGAVGQTTEATGTLTPSWNESVLIGARNDFAAGVRVDIVATCQNGAVDVGAARILPGPNAFDGRSFTVRGFGGGSELRLRWQPLQPASGSGSYYYQGAYYEDAITDPVYVDGSSSSNGARANGDATTCDGEGDCSTSSSITVASDGTTDPCAQWSGLASGNDPSVAIHLLLCEDTSGHVHGSLAWSGAQSGTNLRTVEGAWTADHTSLAMHDVAIPDSHPNRGWRFCLVDTYSLSSGSNSLAGTYHSSDCDDDATMTLKRTMDGE